MLNNIVDNTEQWGQQNIVQCCLHQTRTVCSFNAVGNIDYAELAAQSIDQYFV